MGTDGRRTQAERRADTQRRLLDATLECLVEHGYAGTTAARIVERAGLTRGAQSHYYATIQDLVVAAVEHLAERRSVHAFASLGRVLEADDPLDALLDLLWELHADDTFTATVELWVAARTDPELRGQLGPLENVAIGPLQAALRALVDDRELRSHLTAFVYTAMDAVRGLLLSGFVLDDETIVAARWVRAKGELRRLAQAHVDASGTPLTELLETIAARADV